MAKGETTTQRQSDAPWKESIPGLMKTNEMALDWLKSPSATSTYQGTRVIPFSQQTQAGMNQMTGTAQNAIGAMQNPLKSYSGMYGVLDPIARGDFSNATAFNNVLGGTLQDTQDRIATEMSSLGRGGGGLHQATLARSLGDVSNQAKLDYQNWALGGLQGIGDRMAGAYQNAQAPGQTFMQMGAMQEDLAGKYAQEQMDKFNEQKMAPINAASQANAIFTGSGQLGGTSKGTTFTPQNVGQQALGYGTAALGAGK
jgi:hypothetical protein